jgi:hypothetical protein
MVVFRRLSDTPLDNDNLIELKNEKLGGFYRTGLRFELTSKWDIFTE